MPDWRHLESFLQHTHDTLRDLRLALVYCRHDGVLNDVETLVAAAEDEARRELSRIKSRPK